MKGEIISHFRTMADMVDAIQIVVTFLLVVVNIVNMGLAAASVYESKYTYDSIKSDGLFGYDRAIN